MMEPIRVPSRNAILFWVIALGGAGFDLAAKAAVFNWLPLGATHTVTPGLLEIHPSYNKGALWGFGAWLPGSGYIFAGLSVAAGIAICYWLFARRAAADLGLCAALGLIMAGAMGNCYDRLMLGQVRDFVHFHVDSIRFDCAIFNFADNMLVLGALFLMVLALRPESRREQPGEDTPNHPVTHESATTPMV